MLSKVAITAITTSNSMSVNPVRRRISNILITTGYRARRLTPHDQNANKHQKHHLLLQDYRGGSHSYAFPRYRHSANLHRNPLPLDHEADAAKNKLCSF